MTDFRGTTSDQQNWLELLADKIPGYSGYKQKEIRRQDDLLVRESLVKQCAVFGTFPFLVCLE